MFFQFRKSERAALAPLLELVRCYHGYDRLHFLAELERDAPTVVVLLRRMLAEEEGQVADEARGLPSGNAPYAAARVPSSSGVSLAHVGTPTTAA